MGVVLGGVRNVDGWYRGGARRGRGGRGACGMGRLEMRDGRSDGGMW